MRPVPPPITLVPPLDVIVPLIDSLPPRVLVSEKFVQAFNLHQLDPDLFPFGADGNSKAKIFATYSWIIPQYVDEAIAEEALVGSELFGEGIAIVFEICGSAIRG